AGLTPRLRTLLKRCLERDPKARIPDVSAVKFLLQEALVDNEAVPSAISPIGRKPVWKRALPYGLTAVVAAAVTWAAVRILTPVARPSVTRLQFTLPEGQFFTNVGRNVIAISPDGRKIVYNAGSRLHLRSMSEAGYKPIPGTEVFQAVTNPVFSPDGQWVAFYAVSDRAIKRIPVTGGV